MTVTEKLARFVVDTSYYEIPQKTVKHAKELALTNLGQWCGAPHPRPVTEHYQEPEILKES